MTAIDWLFVGMMVVGFSGVFYFASKACKATSPGAFPKRPLDRVGTSDEMVLRRQLVEWIMHRSWECTNGVLSEALIAEAIESAAFYCDIHLVRRHPAAR